MHFVSETRIVSTTLTSTDSEAVAQEPKPEGRHQLRVAKPASPQTGSCVGDGGCYPSKLNALVYELAETGISERLVMLPQPTSPRSIQGSMGQRWSRIFEIRYSTASLR